MEEEPMQEGPVVNPIEAPDQENLTIDEIVTRFARCQPDQEGNGMSE